MSPAVLVRRSAKEQGGKGGRKEGEKPVLRPRPCGVCECEEVDLVARKHLLELRPREERRWELVDPVHSRAGECVLLGREPEDFGVSGVVGEEEEPGDGDEDGHAAMAKRGEGGVSRRRRRGSGAGR